MRASWRRQESSWVTTPLINRQRIGMPCGELLAVLQLFTENLPDGVRFREVTAIKTWKRLKLQRYGIDIICAFATIYKPAISKYHPCTPVDPC